MTTKQRQHLLAYLGYYVGKVDGIWAALSKTACTVFQKDFGGIAVDGYGGPETDEALRHTVGNGMPAKKVDDAVDNNVGDKPEPTGTFWDEIEYLTREEFRCQCGGKYCSGFPAEHDQTLVELLDDVREYSGRPGHRSSGLRCKTWNAIQKALLPADTNIITNANIANVTAIEIGSAEGAVRSNVTYNYVKVVKV